MNDRPRGTQSASCLRSRRGPTRPFVTPGLVLQALVGHREETPAAIERVGFPAAMSHRLVLRAAAALVELGVRELDDVKRVRHLGGAGELLVEHRARSS